MRSKFNTSIAAFGMNIPVGVYTAVESHDISFHSYHLHDDGSAGRIQVPYVCADCGAVVPRGEAVSGIEPGEPHNPTDHVLIVTKEEKAEIAEDTGNTLEVLQWAHADEIDPIMLESPNYLAPPAKASDNDLKSYKTLVAVLTESRWVGIIRFTERGKTHTAVLSVRGDVLVLQPIIWADELRAPDFEVLRRHVELNPKLVKVMHALVEAELREFDVSEYTDDATIALGELLAAKAAKRSRVRKPRKKATGEPLVDDLLARLEQTVAAKKEAAALDKSIAAHPAGKKAARKTAPKKAS